MRKPLTNSKSLCLTASWALLAAGLLTSCSSKPKGPFSEKEMESNLFYQAIATTDNVELRAKAEEDPYQLLRATFPEFLKMAKSTSDSNAWLSTLPGGEIFGDIHVQQPTWRNLKLDLDDWDTIAQGPYWLDLLRAESSALVWTRALGFRNEYDYPCINAYTNVLVRGQKVEDPKVFDSFIKANTDKDQSTESSWTKAPPLKDSEKAIYQSFLKFVEGQNLPINTETPVRSFSSGIGSFSKTKLLFLSQDNVLWELKEVDAHPLEAYQTDKQQGSLCSRYDNLLKSDAYPSSKPKACFEFEGRVFTLLQWTHSYFSLKAKHIQSFDQLHKHTEWVCSSLAEFHLKSMDKSKQRKWSMILKSPAPFQTTHKRMSREVADEIQKAYQMLLLSQQN